jgi:O-antigen ligase
MPSLDLLFAWTIAILAGLACIGALAVVLVAEWYAIMRTIRRHRRPDAAGQTPASARYWREHSAVTVPERHP